MHRRTGSADLPLHGGSVPAWLSVRMAAMGRLIVEAIVLEYGRDELLRRLAHPLWFQSFGAVMGMDWHSSGITTSVIGALKRGLEPVRKELGVYVCGGKGAQSRRTPEELTHIGDGTGVDAAALVRASRLVAKIDSAAVQDGFELYLHGFFATVEGRWCVVQQGMNGERREARRYHWQSENLPGFFESPHAAIEGTNVGSILNLADARAARNRDAALELAQSGPAQPLAVLERLRGRALVPARRIGTRNPAAASLPLFDDAIPMAAQREPHEPHLRMPHRHDIRISDVFLKRLHATLAAAAQAGPRDYAELLLTPRVGARTVEALAFVAEILHGAPARFDDPARFAMAHGGKDGHPFPVPLDIFDRTIGVLKSAVNRARLGSSEQLAALKRLDHQARLIENLARGPSLGDHVAGERALSPEFGGRQVGGPRPGRRINTGA